MGLAFQPYRDWRIGWPCRSMTRASGCRLRLHGKVSDGWRRTDRTGGPWPTYGPGRIELRPIRKPRCLRCTTDDGVVEDQNEDGIVELDEELETEASGSEGTAFEPLKEALDRAKALSQSSSFKREALEAEAQGVAELAVEARDAFKRSNKKLEEAVSQLEGFAKEKQGLEERKEELAGRKLEISQAKRIEEEEAQFDGEDVMARLEGGLSLSSAEWISEYDEGSQMEDFAANVQASADLNKELKEIAAEYESATERISELAVLMEDQESKIQDAKEKVYVIELEAKVFEERASAVMTACQTAVTNELEAKAVLKETEAALDKAMKESEALESTQEVDEDEEEEEEEEISDVADKNEPSEKAKTRMETEETPSVLMPLVEVPSAAPAERMEKKKDASTEEKQRPAVLFLKKHGVAVGTALLFAAASIVFLQSPAGKSLVASAGGFFSKLSYHLGRFWHYIIPSTHAGEEGFLQTIWLLLMSVVMVPLVLKGIPGGTPILGFLIAGALVGPHALAIVKDMEGVHMLGELGVVFLLFNIGLELSLERLRSMAKLVFGLGNAQVLVTILAVAFIAASLTGVSGPAAIVVGCALALSSTAVAMQVLQDRGENGSRHGRATFSVLLLQDLAVVVVLIMIPLLAPKNVAMTGGMRPILKVLGTAAVKATVCITGIIVGGRVLLRPIYRAIAGFENKEIFAALTLLVVLGASKLTAVSGLSLALGAFLAGLLLAETEYVLQVESDIAPYKGLLMGLFFMSVGMEISVGPLFTQWKSVLMSLTILLVGKAAIMAIVGPFFGLSRVTALRSGLLLAAGGEFAFVTLGEAEVQGILSSPLVNQIYLVVALSMALLPYLAMLGGKFGQMFEKSDMRALQPRGEETGSQKDHVIIAGFGRVGSLIAGLLSERLIPYVALDVRSDRVQSGKALDLPVYFGDAGSQAVLQSVGAQNAACIVVALDSPGANYRCVWAANRHFPHVPIYVRARDVDHGRNLSKAGASVVVPETLEPSLQLAASVLNQVKVSPEEVGVSIGKFRRTHLAELATIAREAGYSMGYGFNRLEDDTMEEEDDDLEAAALGAAAAPEGA